MTSPTLIVFDESCDTANVLAAVYEPQGVVVEHQRPVAFSRAQSARPFVAVRNRDRLVTIENSLQHDSEPEDVRPGSPMAEHRLSALFQYRDLIAAVDAMLSDRVAA